MAARTGKTTGTPKKGAKNASPQKPVVAPSASPTPTEKPVVADPKLGKPAVRFAKSGRPLSGNAGKGRPPGVPNKIAMELRDMIRLALEEEGGVQYLRWLSRAKAESFSSLVSKILPTKIEGTVAMTVADLVTQAAKDDK